MTSKLTYNYFNLIGFPDDIGIINTGGRKGSKLGPKTFCQYFDRLNSGKNQNVRFHKVEFSKVSKNLESNHLAAAKLVSKATGFPIVIGGGHDYAAPWVTGLKHKHKKLRIGCLNVDAHLDLRIDFPKMNSGAPFYRLIQNKVINGKDLVEFGVQDHCNAPALWDFAKKKKVQVIPYSKIRNKNYLNEFSKQIKYLEKNCDMWVLSVDLDALSLAYAPGVSAPQSEGFSSSDLVSMLQLAASSKKLMSVGLFELSPANDIQDQTSRLAAQSVWKFMQFYLENSKI